MSENTARLSMPLLGFPLAESGHEKVPGIGTTELEAVKKEESLSPSDRDRQMYTKSILPALTLLKEIHLSGTRQLISTFAWLPKSIGMVKKAE